MCLLAMNSVYSSTEPWPYNEKRAMPCPNPVPLVAKQSHSISKILWKKIWATAGNEPGSEGCATRTIQNAPGPWTDGPNGLLI